MRPAAACVPVVLLALASLAAAQAPAPAAAAPHFPTNDDLRHLRAVSSPQLSPDGRQVLFTVTDSTADGARPHLWLAPVADPDASQAKARQLTFSPPADKRGERGAQWSPDGQAIYFLAHRSEHTQLFRLDLRGGEAAPLDLKLLPAVDESKEKDAIPPPAPTPAPPVASAKPADTKPEAAPEPIETDISGFALSADGKWLAFWARDPETPGEKKQKDAKADATWVNHDAHLTRLYLPALNPDGLPQGSPHPASVPPDIHSAVWSQAAGRLLVLTEPPNDLSDLGPASQLFVLDAAAPDKPHKLASVPLTVAAAAFSPDESAIVF
ncbi:MAG: hypothetical protein WCE75_02780, partial [Terracidiphilus sp.]